MTKKLYLLCIAIVFASGFSITVTAETKNFLKPFKHTYNLSVKSFINLSGKLSRELKLVNHHQNKWQFTVSSEASFGLNSKLISHFILDNRQHIHSVQLTEKKPGFSSGKADTMAFGYTDYALLDKANIQIQLRQDLRNGLDINKLSYKIWQGDKYKTYRFRKIGTENLTTPAGKFNTLLIERLVSTADKQKNHKRLFWFAPDKDYLLVKYYQKNKDTTYSAVLAEY